jgi:hypothetical protein
MSVGRESQNMAGKREKRENRRTRRDGSELLSGLRRQAELALEGRKGDGGTNEGRVVSVERGKSQHPPLRRRSKNEETNPIMMAAEAATIAQE